VLGQADDMPLHGCAEGVAGHFGGGEAPDRIGHVARQGGRVLRVRVALAWRRRLQCRLDARQAGGEHARVAQVRIDVGAREAELEAAVVPSAAESH
jgi:hypothetical protein